MGFDNYYSLQYYSYTPQILQENLTAKFQNCKFKIGVSLFKTILINIDYFNYFCISLDKSTHTKNILENIPALLLGLVRGTRTIERTLASMTVY